MKRTLFAVGVAVLLSLIFVPYGPPDMRSADKATQILWQGGGVAPYRQPFFFFDHPHHRVDLEELLIQTVFAAVTAALLVNIPWKRKRDRAK